MITIILPWPPKALSPNSRGHWSIEYRAKRKARNDAYLFTKAVLGGKESPFSLWNEDNGKIQVHCLFYPKADYAFDEDGLASRMKAFFDGIADGLSVDDRHFRHSMELMPKDKDNPRVEVRIG